MERQRKATTLHFRKNQQLNHKKASIMKKTVKIFIVAAVSALFATACNVDKVNPTYSPTNASGVSFVQGIVDDTEILASASTYDIALARGNASSALTVNIVGDDIPAGVVCPSTATFAAGEYSTVVSLDITGMEVGEAYSGTISIADGEYNEDIAIASLDFNLAKAYTWVSLGTGQFCEAFWEGFFSECEVLKAEGFERYRFINPYGPSAESVKKPEYIDIWVINEDGNVKWNTYNTGFDYDGAGSYIKAYWPSDLSASYAAKEAYSGFWEKDIIVLVPCFYIDGVGGWPTSNYPIAFCLPGRSQESFEAWLTEQGIW